MASLHQTSQPLLDRRLPRCVGPSQIPPARLRETGRSRAGAVAEQYERAAKAKGNSQRVRKTLSEFLRDHYGEELPFDTVRHFVAPMARRTRDRDFNRYIPALFRRCGKIPLLPRPEGWNPSGGNLEDADSCFPRRFGRHKRAGDRQQRAEDRSEDFRSARIDGYLLSDPARGSQARQESQRFWNAARSR